MFKQQQISPFLTPYLKLPRNQKMEKRVLRKDTCEKVSSGFYSASGSN